MIQINSENAIQRPIQSDSQMTHSDPELFRRWWIFALLDLQRACQGLTVNLAPPPRKLLSAFLLPTNGVRHCLYGGYYFLCLCVDVAGFLSRKHDCEIKRRRQTNKARFTPPAAATARWFNASVHSSDWLFTALTSLLPSAAPLSFHCKQVIFPFGSGAAARRPNATVFLLVKQR